MKRYLTISFFLVAASTCFAEPASAASLEKTWTGDVFIPLARFAGIAAIFGVLLASWKPTELIKEGVWSERTFFALAVVLTFCASALIGISDETMRSLKDVALVVIGFYFGAAKAKGEK